MLQGDSDFLSVYNGTKKKILEGQIQMYVSQTSFVILLNDIFLIFRV